jgi:hypothetical protein
VRLLPGRDRVEHVAGQTEREKKPEPLIGGHASPG